LGVLAHVVLGVLATPHTWNQRKKKGEKMKRIKWKDGWFYFAIGTLVLFLVLFIVVTSPRYVEYTAWEEKQSELIANEMYSMLREKLSFQGYIITNISNPSSIGAVGSTFFNSFSSYKYLENMESVNDFVLWMNLTASSKRLYMTPIKFDWDSNNYYGYTYVCYHHDDEVRRCLVHLSSWGVG